MKYFALTCILVAIVGCSEAPDQDDTPTVPEETEASKLLQYDGVYRALQNDPEVTSNIRFYPDKTVQTATTQTSADLQKIKNWFNKDHETSSFGTYELDVRAITFVAKRGDAEKGVEYSGEILPDGSLLLNSHSLLNDHRAERTYEFVAW